MSGPLAMTMRWVRLMDKKKKAELMKKPAEDIICMECEMEMHHVLGLVCDYLDLQFAKDDEMKAGFISFIEKRAKRA